MARPDDRLFQGLACLGEKAAPGGVHAAVRPGGAGAGLAIGEWNEVALGPLAQQPGQVMTQSFADHGAPADCQARAAENRSQATGWSCGNIDEADRVATAGG